MAYFTTPKGTSLHIQFKCKSACQAVDLTGWTTTAKVYNSDGSLNTTWTPTIIADSNGILSIDDLLVTPSQTTTLGAGSFTLVVWLTSGNGSESYEINNGPLVITTP